MNEKEYVKVSFEDKYFRIRVREPSAPYREIALTGPEAREVFKQLNEKINTRPRSEDDRLSLEQEGKQE